MKTIEGWEVNEMTKDVREQKSVSALILLGFVAYIGILINHFA